jgi:hypothetical protein
MIWPTEVSELCGCSNDVRFVGGCGAAGAEYSAPRMGVIYQDGSRWTLVLVYLDDGYGVTAKVQLRKMRSIGKY